MAWATSLATFDRHGFRVERIIASGGATRSPLFMQIYADVVGQPLYVTRESEASLLGSAVVAAYGAGLYPDLASASRQMVSISHEYTPDEASHAEYAYYLQKYQETYRQLRDLMQEMNRRQTK